MPSAQCLAGGNISQVMTISGCALALALPLSVFRSALIGSGRFDLVNLVETQYDTAQRAAGGCVAAERMGLDGAGDRQCIGDACSAPGSSGDLPKGHSDFRTGFRLVRIHRLQEVAPLPFTSCWLILPCSSVCAATPC